MRKEWETKFLGDLCEFSRGLTYAKGDEVESSNNVVLRATNIDLATNRLDLTELKYISDKVAIPDSKKVKKDSLIICTASGSKSHLGKVALVEDEYDYAFGGFMGMLTPRSGLLPKFLFYRLISEDYKDFIGALSDGVNINNLKFEDLRKFSVPIPPPEQQQRVVGVLDEAFAGLATAQAHTEKNFQNARGLFESHLESVFRRRSIGWVEVRRPLADLCDLIVDCEHKTAPTQEKGIPSIRTPNIGRGRLLLDGVYRVSEETYKAWTRRAEPLAGDLIFAREAPAGNVAVIPENTRVCLGQRTVLIRPKAHVFEPSFLAFLLLESSTQAKLLAHSRGATVQHVNMKDIRALDVGAIPPLGVQRSIVSTLWRLDAETQRLEGLYERKQAALTALKKSLLHQAFTGAL